MKLFTTFFIVLFLCACGEPSKMQAHAQTSREEIYVLIENGGTIAEKDQDEARNTVFHLFQQITTLARRKATKTTQVHIILSALPNRITWSGSVEQLLEQAEDVKNLIVFKPTFSDLVMAFDQIETTINLTQPETIRLYWIGSTINVPFRATDAPVEVQVPQEVPADLALSRIAPRLSTLRIMRVHPDQDKVLQAYLASIGVLKRAHNGELDFALLGDAQTRSRLNTLL